MLELKGTGTNSMGTLSAGKPGLALMLPSNPTGFGDEPRADLTPLSPLAGATFMDGTTPLLLTTARSVRGAEALFHTYGRARSRYQLRWSKPSEIKKNVRHVIDAGDNYVTIIDRNGSFIDEMRRVRNRIAHNNSQSRKHYREVVRRHYGAYLNNVTPGTLLLSPRITPCLLDQYIIGTRVLAKDLVKA